jgi:hypothetical protein
MITFLLSPIGKLVGAAGLLLAAFLGFRLWLASHDSQLLSGYVLRVEAETAKAQVFEMQRQIAAGQIVVDSYQVQLKNLRKAQAVEDAADEKKDKDYEDRLKAAGSLCGFTGDDLDFLLHN